ncbi:Rieske (2Fe-2S) protein [Haloarchaeobius sp. DFWS5]|uniref:Rieske (2Fe-2S) protein n=1 Tax=Haloarchaeobius sp. DFWS5 TaxID=3446114 RepID=UPI003EB69647
MSVDDWTRLVPESEIPERGSYLFTVQEPSGALEEVILVRGDDCIEAWKNFCLHEPDQRLDRGMGAAMRDGEVICPKHGSMFDACSGYCDNGDAAGETLVNIDTAVEDGTVYLTDGSVEFHNEGGIDAAADEDDDGDDMPGSSSHLQF